MHPQLGRGPTGALSMYLVTCNVDLWARLDGNSIFKKRHFNRHTLGEVLTQ